MLLSGAGKTTILYRLQVGEVVTVNASLVIDYNLNKQIIYIDNMLTESGFSNKI
jgi:hypothetical protein